MTSSRIRKSLGVPEILITEGPNGSTLITPDAVERIPARWVVYLLSDEQVKKIGPVDVLMIPVGGVYSINGEDAKKVVEQNCVTCHGPNGKGDGPAAAALPPPKPADWTSSRVASETDGEIFWKISNGRGAMPPWKHLPEQQRWELVNYIRSLQAKK